MKKVCLSCFLFLGLPTFLCAQGSLSGTVINSATGGPITGASLFIEAESQLKKTDSQGRYSFTSLPSGNYVLVVFAEGFSTLTTEVAVGKQEEKLQFRLDSLSLTSETVEVAAMALEYGLQRLRNVEGVAIYAAKKSEVIDMDRVQGNLAANNAREVYRGIAGLNIWESDGAGIQLAIGARGLDPNRTSNFNTRQNGYDISADALGYPESYYTPPTQALRRIEIVRGAASLQYGTQFGGLLNFVFKEGPEDKKFEFATENSAGSFGFLSTFNSIGGTKGKLNYYAFYQRRQGDGWRSNSGFQQNTAYVSTRLNTGRGWKTGLEFTHMDYLAQQPGGLQDFEFSQDPRQSKRARNWFRVDWNLMALTFDRQFSERTRFNLRNFLLIAGRDALGELGPINRPDPMRERDLITGDYRNFGTEGRLIHRYELFRQPATFLAGFRYYQGRTRNRQGDGADGSDPEFRFLNPGDLEKSDYQFPSRNLAFFAENLVNINPRLTVTPGLRFEYIRTASTGFYKQRIFSGGQLIFEQKLEDDQLNERALVLLGLGSGYKVSEHIELYANLSQNYRAINFSDLAVVNPNLVVDSLLRDERGYNADLGLRGSLAGDRLRFDLTLFYLRYNNRIGLSEIILEDQVVPRAAAFRTNIGNARVLGVESYVEADIWRLLKGGQHPASLSVFVNFSLLDGQYLSGGRDITGNDVELIPPVSIKTGLSLRHRHFRASFQYSYVRQHYTDATNAEFVADATRGLIPSYSVLDLSAAYQLGRFRLQAGVNNLADAAYFTRRATAYPGPGIIPADGRSFYGGLRFSFYKK